MSAGDPLRQPVAELLRDPGSRLQVSTVLVADELRVTASRVEPGDPVRLEATLESLGDAIAVSGTVTFDWTGECRRCLREVRESAEVEVREVYSRLEDEDSYPLEEDEIDLEPLVREVVLLELPLAPLCGPDCAGPAPEAFPAGPVPAEEDEDRDAERPRDPRWAPLDDLDLG